MDGWMDGWMDRWMDGLPCVFDPFSLPSSSFARRLLDAREQKEQEPSTLVTTVHFENLLLLRKTSIPLFCIWKEHSIPSSTMKLSQVVLAAVAASVAHGFLPVVPKSTVRCETSSSSLNAIGPLVRKAKEATLKKYISEGIEDNVMEQYKIIQAALEKDDIDLNSQSWEVGPLQSELHKRKGTITVIAEYKRKLADSSFINESYDPEVLSPEFREFGASGVAIMADERMGGCTYADLKVFVEEQRQAKAKVPGPVMVINNDLVIDELQVAQSAAYGAAAVVLSLQLLGDDETSKLMKASRAVAMEVIVTVSSQEEAQKAIDLGARMLSVINVPGVDDKVKVIENLVIPEGRKMTMIANILHKNNKGFEEIEEAWGCRDKGFSCAWVSDVLYKSGNDPNEHPGAIIRSMKAKSSLKWASPKASSGRGEGAKEYLGDIMM
jgi:indole-3-glycerol phosphate synthase